MTTVRINFHWFVVSATGSNQIVGLSEGFAAMLPNSIDFTLRLVNLWSFICNGESIGLINRYLSCKTDPHCLFQRPATLGASR